MFYTEDRVFAFCEGWRSACTDNWTFYLCFPTTSCYAAVIRTLTKWLQNGLEVTYRDHLFAKRKQYFSFPSQSCFFFWEREVLMLPFIAVFSYLWWFYDINCPLRNWPSSSFQSGLREKKMMFNPLNHLTMSQSVYHMIAYTSQIQICWFR